MRVATHWDKGKKHEDAPKNEFIGALGVSLVNVVHVSSAGNDLHTHMQKASDYVGALHPHGHHLLRAVS